MPQFAPGDLKTAIAPITVRPTGLSAQAELFLGPNDTTKVATSGRKAFTSTGAQQNINLPVTMPTSPGTYHVYLDVYAGGMPLAGFIADEDVVIQAPPKFYMPAKFTKALIYDFWWIYYYQDFECPITNKGGSVGTQTIFVGNDHPSDRTPWSFNLTLQPGETYLWKHQQMAIWPMKFYLQGDWIGNNYSEGMAQW